MTLVEIGSTRTQMFFDLETNGITMVYTRNDDPSSRHALQQPCPLTPFTAGLLSNGDLSPGGHAPVDALPASYRDQAHALSSLDEGIVDKELDLSRLDRVAQFLWITGRLMSPRPLHQQLCMGREVVLMEQTDMHLVWEAGRIYMKPLPRYLLDPAFWKQYLCSAPYCACHSDDPERIVRQRITQDGHPLRNKPCRQRKVAMGFLYSYVALIQHESDFHIAQDKRLIPADITWSSWRQLVREMLEYPNIYRHMDYRFWHGEMRLSRLNKIFYLWQTPGRYYSTRWQQYSTFFGETFAYLAAMTVYILLVLTALQLGISTKLLENSTSFDRVSAGFAVFSIVGPFGVAFGLFLVFLYFFVDNYRATLRFRDMRLGIIKNG